MNSSLESPVLVADLDGTLCRTDTLHEAVAALVTTAPLTLLKLPGWASRGKAEFKAKLADEGLLDPAAIPLNMAVLETLRTARADGRRTALVSASDHRQVTAIADHTGLFDEAYGTAQGRNLKGENKAAFLSEHYGAGNFDYMGDARADLPVWRVARKAITVGAGAGLRRAAEAVNANTSHIAPPSGTVRAMFRAARPHQWSKNALLFLPMFAAHDFTNLLSVVLAFVAFCLIASMVYVINDLLDLAADRTHPRKKNRPFASGDLTAAQGLAMSGALFLVALLLALSIGNLPFLGVLAVYVIATFAYSLWLKRRLIIDVLMLAGLYSVRIFAGAAAASVVISPWMLGFSMFLFLGLAAVKRQGELTDQLASGRSSQGRAYEVEDLPVLRGIALSAGHAAILVLALYISSDTVQTLYAQPAYIWLVCPILLYWFLRMVIKTHRGLMPDDPIVFAATDRISLLLIIAATSVVVAAV